jgi:hypothetical protein
MVKVWKARHTKIRIALASTFDITQTGTSLYDLATTPTQIECKAENVTIAEPEGGADTINLLGVQSTNIDTTKYTQCSEFDEKPFGLATISGTLVHDEDTVLEAFFMAVSKAVSVGTTEDYVRWAIGSIDRPEVVIVVQLIDGTSEVNIALDNAIFTKTGDRRIDSADGHWQQDFEAVCAPLDYYVEYRTR